MASVHTGRDEEERSRSERFVAWVNDAGGFIHPSVCLFAPLSHGGDQFDRGVICTDVVEPNDTLLLIPLRLCLYMPLSDDFVVCHTTLSLTKDKHTQENLPASVAHLAGLKHKPSHFICTVLILLSEAALGSKSYYAPYIDTLPDGHDALIAWTDDEVALLRGTELDCQVDGRVDGQIERKLTYDIYDEVVLPIIRNAPELWPLSFCTAQKFDWAFGCVQTRAFQLSDKQDCDTTLYIVPGADMLNHTSDKRTAATTLQLVKSNCEPGNQFDGLFALNAERVIHGGEEIRHSYGNLSDAQLIQTFGFFDLPAGAHTSNNPHNTVHLNMVKVVKAAQSIAPVLGVGFDIVERVQHLQSYGFAKTHFNLPFSSAVTDQLLTFVQAIIMPPEDFLVYENEALLLTNGGGEPQGEPASTDQNHNGGRTRTTPALQLPLLLEKSDLAADPEAASAVLLVLLKATHQSMQDLPSCNKNTTHCSDDEMVKPTAPPDSRSAWRRACAQHLTDLQFQGLDQLKRDLSELLTRCDKDGDGGRKRRRRRGKRRVDP